MGLYKHIIKTIVFAALFFFSAETGNAQSFTAAVDQNQVAIGEQIELTFTVAAGGGKFYPPALTDFDILAGPNQSSFTQFVNGQMTQSFSLSYVLRARTEGSFKIAPATMEVNGQKIQSNALTIKVTKGSSKPGQTAGGGDQEVDLGNNIFIKSVASKSSVYQGEAISVTFRLYTRVTITDYIFDKIPAFTGFYTEDIQLPKNAQLRREVVNGINYNVIDVKKVILFPQYSGNLSVEPISGEFVVRVPVKRKGGGRSNDIFDQFFNDPFFSQFDRSVQDIKVRIKSEPIKVLSKALPIGAPASFKGAVGQFSMDAFIDKPQTNANESVNLKVKISGAGNLKLIDPPSLTIPPDIESFDPKKNDAINLTASGVSGSRTFEYLLIPRYMGEYKIAPIEFSYFDINKKQYVTLSSKEFQLKVAKGNGPASAVGGSVNKEDVSLIGSDIRFIKSNSFFHDRGDGFFGSILFWLLLGIPVVSLGSSLYIVSRKRTLNANLALSKSLKANKMARKRLASANQMLKEQNKSAFYDEISKALWGYASDKLNLPLSQLNKDTASARLHSLKVSESNIQHFISTIDKCEFARFAPGGSSEMSEVYENSVKLISALDTELKG